jgi:hypothetical protein
MRSNRSPLKIFAIAIVEAPGWVGLAADAQLMLLELAGECVDAILKIRVIGDVSIIVALARKSLDQHDHSPAAAGDGGLQPNIEILEALVVISFGKSVVSNVAELVGDDAEMGKGGPVSRAVGRRPDAQGQGEALILSDGGEPGSLIVFVGCARLGHSRILV